jgi:hypothetical protein
MRDAKRVWKRGNDDFGGGIHGNTPCSSLFRNAERRSDVHDMYFDLHSNAIFKDGSVLSASRLIAIQGPVSRPL